MTVDPASIAPAGAPEPLPDLTVMTVAPERPVRRRGIYKLHDFELAQLMRLDPGQYVTGVHTDWPTISVLIMVEGDGLPVVDEACVAPILSEWQHQLTRVGQLPPAAQHVAVMLSLESVRLAEREGHEGRRAILDRHAPSIDDRTGAARCQHCCGGCQAQDPEPWPCADYLDAARGLVTELQAPA